MATSKRTDSTARKTPAEDPSDEEVTAGLFEAFGNLAEIGPQMLDLHRDLLEGAIQSGIREMERLADIDPEHALLEGASQRIDHLTMQRNALASVVRLGGRLAAALGWSRALQGYVALEDGSPAEGYTVRIATAKEMRIKAAQARAKTDEEGYFRIDIGLPDEAAGPEPEPARPLDIRQPAVEAKRGAATAAAPATEAEAAKAEAARDGAAVPGSKGDGRPLEIEILDRKGAVVFRDPMPPSIDALAASPRYYVVP